MILSDLCLANEYKDETKLGSETFYTESRSGILLTAASIGEVFSNHGGGVDSGSAFASLIDVGVELDLEVLAGWKDASVVANAFYFSGKDISGEYVGDFNAVSNLYTDTSFNLYNIYFQKGFGSKGSFFKLGQVALDDDFMVSESALLFLNASFGPLPVQSGNTGAPVYSLAAPGAVMKYSFGDASFCQFGMYVGDAGEAVSGNQGFGWRTGRSAGWMLISEVGFHYGEDDASVVKLGGYYHTGKFERFSDGLLESGLFSVYAVIDHRVCSLDGGGALNVFFRGGVTPQDDISVVHCYADLGLVAADVLKSGDLLGMATFWTQFSEDFLNVEDGRSSEFVIEITYQFPVNEYVVIQPDIQCILSPQGGGDDAFLTGFRVEVSF